MTLLPSTHYFGTNWKIVYDLRKLLSLIVDLKSRSNLLEKKIHSKCESWSWDLKWVSLVEVNFVFKNEKIDELLHWLGWASEYWRVTGRMGYWSSPYSPIIVGMSHKWSLSQLLKYGSVNTIAGRTSFVLQYFGRRSTYKLYTYGTTI